MFDRRPDALGALQPMMSAGKPIDFENIEELDEDAALGVGKVEDFTWKGLLDFTTCTECGRCQSQCPAWNTEKPLSPKLLMMDLREHAYAKAPYLLASRDETRESLPELVHAEAERPLVGAEPTYARDRPRRAVVLHVVRRVRAAVPGRHRARRPHHGHAPLPGAGRVERSRPSSTGCSRAWRTRATRGTWPRPRGWTGPRTCRSRSSRSAPTSRTLAEVEYLFWVGCAGAYEDRAKKTTRRSPSCCTSPASTSPYWATARPAPATRPAAPATSSSSSSSRCRTPRSSRRPRRRRSSPPARTASTP